MRARTREMKAARANKGRAEEGSAVLATIAEMPESDRGMAERIHAIVTVNAPSLAPRLGYGMPAYARDSVVVCFFQAAHKFNTRYATLGFTDAACRNDGETWATALVKRAAG